jgi:hypothetical protein
MEGKIPVALDWDSPLILVMKEKEQEEVLCVYLTR